MKDYVLVIRENNGFRIGVNRYTKSAAANRLKEVKKVGINNMETV